MRAQIALLPGDGIGPEVTAAAVSALDAVARCWGHELSIEEAPIGGAAIDLCGEPLPLGTFALCRRADAVLLGAVGGPRWDRTGGARPEQGLLALRRRLGVFANVRPIRLFDALADSSPLRPERIAGVDLVFVRELTGGLYFGRKRRVLRRDGTERASEVCAYTTAEIERVVRAAAALARTRSGRLTSVDKANVLETSRLWREVTTRVVRAEFPDVRLDHRLVDACAMQLITSPTDFDVIVTENLFGDILSDEAAVLAGSIGVLPSASLRIVAGVVSAGLYEPIHGAAPDIAGKDAANPIGAILSAALLLRHSLGLADEARAIEDSVIEALGSGLRTTDIARPGEPVVGTREMGERIVRMVVSRAPSRSRISA
jgi:3-isopropylmalate dehydrogenase